MIYFDNSATTLQKPESVAKTVYEVIVSNTFANSGRSGHLSSHNALTKIFKIRAALAQFFNVKDPLNIALCQNATTALNLVIKSLFGAEDHIITTALEHNSVLRPLYQLEEQGAYLSIIGFDIENGELNYHAMEAAIQKNTKAIIVNACSNVIGTVCNLTAVHDLCMKHGLILIIDGSQSAGTIPFDLSQYENTIFCFTGHKGLYGPQGTGGIAVNGDFVFKPVFSGGSGIHSFNKTHPMTMPDVFEFGTVNLHSFAGLAEGCAYIESYGIHNIQYYLAELRRYFVTKAAAIPHIKVYADQASDTSGIVALNIGNLPSSTVSDILDEQYAIATRSGVHCAPLVHKAFNTEAQGMVRFSFSTFNTKAEIDTAIEVLAIIADTMLM